MQAGIKKIFITLGVMLCAVACISIGYGSSKKTNALEQTNRNESYSPSEYNIAINNTDGYTKIYENKNFEYYYSSSKNIFKFLNKKSGFVWSSGADNYTEAEALSKYSDIKQYSKEYYEAVIDVGPMGNGKATNQHYAEINALLYFTYFTQSKSNVESKTNKVFTKSSLFGHNKYSNEWMVKLESITEVSGVVVNEFKFNIRLTFTETGFDLNMYDEDIYGKSKDYVEAIFPFPCLGQSGGKMIQCRIKSPDARGYGACDFSDLSTISDNPKTNLNGYIFVPDGSGALIRFDNVKYYDNTKYYYDVYSDPYRDFYEKKEFDKGNTIEEPDYVKEKHISMPVWGVAYGNNQDAFVAYATKGSEYFGLVFRGRSHTYEYSSIQPRFERNRTYIVRFSGKTSTQMLTSDEIFHYDIGLSYNFLTGDGKNGELPANYVGMALKYRDYITKNHLIKEDVKIENGPKVDFLICDVKEGIFGYSDVDITSFEQTRNILNELHNSNISHITSTLYGWQNGGITMAKPWTTKYNSNAGGINGLKRLISDAAAYGYDIDLYQQYGMINKAQMSNFNAYCVKALSRDYGIYILADKSKPITWWEYTNADNAGIWLNKQADAIKDLGENVGITTGGISTLLVPDYGKKLTYAQAANSLYQSTKEASSKVTLSGDTPNLFLWKNYEKFTNISVYNSQYQCETDSVPFMEIVLSGLVNMYAEYANFSFYDEIAQLKMIDYNLNPSFIITANENTDVMYTNARDWFSTAYTSYKDMIINISNKVTPLLNLVQGKTIINREVAEFADGSLGLYINTYATYKDGKIANDKTTIAINYFDYPVEYTYNNKKYTIDALSAMELK